MTFTWPQILTIWVLSALSGLMPVIVMIIQEFIWRHP